MLFRSKIGGHQVHQRGLVEQHQLWRLGERRRDPVGDVRDVHPHRLCRQIERRLGLEAGAFEGNAERDGTDELPLQRRAVEADSACEIEEALRMFVRTQRMLIEGAAAVAVASFLKTRRRFSGKNVVIIICGANMNTDTLKGIL